MNDDLRIEKARVIAASKVRKRRLGRSAESGIAPPVALAGKVRNRYVDFRESVRVVVRHLPDGELLASKMTDEWIVGLRRFWTGGRVSRRRKRTPKNPLMVGIYGPEWRTLRPEVVAAYERAINLFRSILQTGRVKMLGVTGRRPEEGRRPIERHEWARHSIDVRRGRLAPLDSVGAEISGVLVAAEDLQRECAAMIASEEAPAVELETTKAPPVPSLESLLRDSLCANSDPTQTEAKIIAPERSAIVNDFPPLGSSSGSPAPAATPRHRDPDRKDRLADELKKKYPDGRPLITNKQILNDLGERAPSMRTLNRAISKLGWSSP